MNRKIAVLALLSCAACYSGDPDLGGCSADTDCKLPDGGQLAGAFCNSNKRCEYACSHICALAEACVNAVCELQGPRITTVSAPTTWALPTANVAVTAVVDDTGGPGIASAILRITGKQDVPGTPSGSGLIQTFSFTVPGNVQAANSETPVNFTVVATDINGGTTPDRAAGSGQLLIDGKPSVVSGVTVTGGVTASGGIKWFKSQAGVIDVQVAIQESGSGVDVASLQLTSGGARFDQPSGPPATKPACVAGTTTVCHFNVPQDKGATQARFDFKVVGADVAGNAIPDNTAALGIDGVPPAVALNGGAVQYPANFSGCNGGTVDGAMYCGHDSNRFWRKGEPPTSKVLFAIDDGTGGSGPPAAAGTVSYYFTTAATGCTQAAPCAATIEGGGVFGVPADFANAPFNSDSEGNGQVSITVTGQDAVGNSGTSTPALVNVTRVKWMRTVAATSLAGAPILSSRLSQVIVAGVPPTIVNPNPPPPTKPGDSIYAIKSDDGRLAWSAGSSSPSIGTVRGNMAWDGTPSADTAHPTPVLYVNSGDNFFALLVSDTGVTQSCVASVSGLTGSPVIFGAGAGGEAVVVGTFTTRAFQLNPAGGGCSEPVTGATFGNPTTHPTLGPPSANGSVVYFGYDNSANTASDLGIKSIPFVSGAFDPTSVRSLNLNVQPSSNAGPIPVSPASDVFFAVNGTHNFHRYDVTLTNSLWASNPTLTASQNIFSQPLVAASLVFGSTTDLEAFRVSDGTTAWTFPGGVQQVSPPTIATGTMFVSDAANKEMIAFDSAAPTPTSTPKWVYGGAAGTSPSTRLASIATEATLGADGVLYFGDSGGHVYALFSDAQPRTTQAGEWPRTGYDNCNSNHTGNTGFVCQ